MALACKMIITRHEREASGAPPTCAVSVLTPLSGFAGKTKHKTKQEPGHRGARH